MLIIGIEEKNTAMFFQEISYHLAANPARFSLEQRPLNQQQLDLYKMLLRSAKKKAKMEAVVEGMRKTTFKDTVQVLDDKGVESEVV